MPFGDGTGPRGEGPRTGRGLGRCGYWDHPYEYPANYAQPYAPAGDPYGRGYYPPRNRFVGWLSSLFTGPGAYFGHGYGGRGRGRGFGYGRGRGRGHGRGGRYGKGGYGRRW